MKMGEWLESSPGCHKASYNGKTWLRGNFGFNVYLAAFKDIKDGHFSAEVSVG